MNELQNSKDDQARILHTNNGLGRGKRHKPNVGNFKRVPKLTKNLNFVSIETKINYVVNSRPSVTWMYQGVSSNKLAHMLD
jgi:hypothetical protein